MLCDGESAKEDSRVLDPNNRVLGGTISLRRGGLWEEQVGRGLDVLPRDAS